MRVGGGVCIHATTYDFPKNRQILTFNKLTLTKLPISSAKALRLDNTLKARYNQHRIRLLWQNHTMGSSLTTSINPANPSEIGTYPPTLPVEIALRTAPLQTICEAYGISHDDWLVLKTDPVFLSDLAAAVELVKKDGMSFKLKAKLQSEELLKTSWKMIHSNNDDVPASVRADLIKFTVRAAGLADPVDKAGANANNLQININLG